MRRILLCLAIAAFPASGWSQAQSPVTWAATSDSTARAGSSLQVSLRGAIGQGWHMYSLTQGEGGPLPTRITLPAGQPFVQAGPIQSTRPAKSFDQNFGIPVETYSDSAIFQVPVRVAAKAPAGPAELRLSVRYQVCNAKVCLPARTEKLAVPLTVQP